MLTYRWKTSPLIKSAELEKRMEGYHATLRLAADALSESQTATLKELPRTLARHGISAYADVDEKGEHILRLTNIPNLKEFFTALKSTSLVTDEKPEFSETKRGLLSGDGKQRSLWQNVQKYAQRLRGVAGQIGDVFLLLHLMEERRLVKSGDLDNHVSQGTVSEKDAGVIRAGSTRNLKLLLTYGTQSAIHTFFGAGKSEVKFDSLMRKVRSSAYARGGELNHLAWLDSGTSQENDGIGRGLFRLFRENAATFSETIPIYGNWQKIKTGLGEGNKKDGSKGVGDWGQFGTGVAQLAVNTIAAYIPEQTKESIEADPNSAWYKKNAVYQWIAAKPIKIQSWVTILDKIPQYMSVFKSAPNLKKRHRYYFWEVTFYGLGRVFGALASKNSEKPNDLEAYQPAFAMAANLLVGLAKDAADKTIVIMSEELAKEIQQQAGIKVKPETIANLISQKLEALKNSPFVAEKLAVIGSKAEQIIADRRKSAPEQEIQKESPPPAASGITQLDNKPQSWGEKAQASIAAHTSNSLIPAFSS